MDGVPLPAVSLPCTRKQAAAISGVLHGSCRYASCATPCVEATMTTRKSCRNIPDTLHRFAPVAFVPVGLSATRYYAQSSPLTSSNQLSLLSPRIPDACIALSSPLAFQLPARRRVPGAPGLDSETWEKSPTLLEEKRRKIIKGPHVTGSRRRRVLV